MGGVRRNRGAPGIDRMTIQQVERYGVDRLLGRLAESLKDGSYRPLPTRRVLIPKPGSREQRPLSIPAVADRIVQAAAKLVLEPVFEGDAEQAGESWRGALVIYEQFGAPAAQRLRQRLKQLDRQSRRSWPFGRRRG